MKKLPIILLISFICAFWIGIYTISATYVDQLAPVWKAEAQIKADMKAKDYADKINNNITRRATITEALPTAIYASMMIGVGLFGLFVFLKMHKRQEAYFRMQDGSFALQWVRVNGVKVLIDPNKMANAFGALTADNVLNSKQAFTDTSAQLKLLTSVDKNRMINALPETGFKYAATGKFLAGGYDKEWKVTEPEIEEEIIESEPLFLSLYDAIDQSTNDNWIIGHNGYDSCEINIYDLVHIGLIGATKTGKTSSTALLAMVYALKNKFHVIALDGKDGVDWERYKDYIEVYATDQTTLPNQITQICQLHDLRMKDLKRYQVSNIDEIEDIKVPHVLVILEEFGYISQALYRSNKRLYADTMSKLSNLMRVSRATGIHFLIIDQKPNAWDSSIVANVKGWICYRLKGKLANGIGEYYLSDLKPVGQFSYDNEKYDAWYTKEKIETLLLAIPKRKANLLKVVTDNVTDNNNRGIYNDEIYTPNFVTDNSDKSDNKVITPPVTNDNRSDNSTDNKPVTSDNVTDNKHQIVTTSLSLKGYAVTEDEKQEVYRVYTLTGSKNKTCKLIWGKAGGYLKYLNEVIKEYEGI